MTLKLKIIALLVLVPMIVSAQQLDEERMRRDVEVAENVLGTLIRQQFNNQRTFFPLEIKGSYQSGYGVTLALPADFTTPIALISTGAERNFFNDSRNVSNSSRQTEIYSYDGVDEKKQSASVNLRDKVREKQRMDLDSVREAFNHKVIEAAKSFIVDYGDMMTQLKPNEKIVITNQGTQPRAWVSQYFTSPKRSHISIEGSKDDINHFRQGKLTRDQMLAKLKVINTETIDTVEADLELLLSMFNRLYSVDLSKTYFTENNIYYERLKDFGVIYYMNVVSTVQIGFDRFQMPTVGLNNVDIQTRNNKVKEIYPQFEQQLKENILEYGRTLKSLNDNELLVFQVNVTRCPECGIPSTVEYNVKGEVLTNFNAGKLDRKAALNKITIKRGADQ